MALDPVKTLDIIELMENYIERIRPSQSIRDQLDIGYRIDNQSIILFEIRPSFMNPAVKLELDYAKTTFVKSENKWKVYWMRGNLKWTLYEPKPKVSNLKRFLELVDEDKYHCFKG
ncbi:hypothetical protein GCM10023187_46380 [Nibrella viscosa]|uniref:DUF3024 domain-containing protein n=1 Tax=Nibrella viscosa TaxID=1084524 RepID=A0ABP8KUV9_9BACT